MENEPPLLKIEIETDESNDSTCWFKPLVLILLNIYTDETIGFTPIEYGGLYVQFMKSKIIITIYKHDAIERSLERIKNMLNNDRNMHECMICCGQSKRFSSCSTCSNSHCLDCMFTLFRNNRGIMVCPFCSSKLGSEQHPLKVEYMIVKMKDQFPS